MGWALLEKALREIVGARTEGDLQCQTDQVASQGLKLGQLSVPYCLGPLQEVFFLSLLWIGEPMHSPAITAQAKDV